MRCDEMNPQARRSFGRRRGGDMSSVTSTVTSRARGRRRARRRAGVGAISSFEEGKGEKGSRSVSAVVTAMGGGAEGGRASVARTVDDARPCDGGVLG